MRYQASLILVSSQESELLTQPEQTWLGHHLSQLRLSSMRFYPPWAFPKGSLHRLSSQQRKDSPSDQWLPTWDWSLFLWPLVNYYIMSSEPRKKKSSTSNGLVPMPGIIAYSHHITFSTSNCTRKPSVTKTCWKIHNKGQNKWKVCLPTHQKPKGASLPFKIVHYQADDDIQRPSGNCPAT